MWYFLADTHFGHANIIKYCKRPFLTNEQLQMCDWAQKGLIDIREIKIESFAVDQMDQRITDSINSVVDYNDNLVIIGDFCLSRDPKIIRSYRKNITCKNVYLIFGNHDNKKACDGVFTASYENYLFKIDGQEVFTSHYPCRSWEHASNGAWMLYGHVHNLYHPEDNGKLMPYDNQILTEGFSSVFAKYNLSLNDDIQKELLDVCASVKGINLTLDVGVDNVRKGVPFGTPWSMTDICRYMQPKIGLWQTRKIKSIF